MQSSWSASANHNNNPHCASNESFKDFLREEGVSFDDVNETDISQALL